MTSTATPIRSYWAALAGDYGIFQECADVEAAEAYCADHPIYRTIELRVISTESGVTRDEPVRQFESKAGRARRLEREAALEPYASNPVDAYRDGASYTRVVRNADQTASWLAATMAPTDQAPTYRSAVTDLLNEVTDVELRVGLSGNGFSLPVGAPREDCIDALCARWMDRAA